MASSASQAKRGTTSFLDGSTRFVSTRARAAEVASSPPSCSLLRGVSDSGVVDVGAFK